MLDLPIGTKFYYDGVLVEVIEYENRDYCAECAFRNRTFEDKYRPYEIDSCCVMACGDKERKDKKDIIFKKVLDN